MWWSSSQGDTVQEACWSGSVRGTPKALQQGLPIQGEEKHCAVMSALVILNQFLQTINAWDWLAQPRTEMPGGRTRGQGGWRQNCYRSRVISEGMVDRARNLCTVASVLIFFVFSRPPTGVRGHEVSTHNPMMPLWDQSG